MSRAPNPEPTSAHPSVVLPYGRPAKKRPSTHLMVCLHQDALEAVMAAMAAHGLTNLVPFITSSALVRALNP